VRKPLLSLRQNGRQRHTRISRTRFSARNGFGHLCGDDGGALLPSGGCDCCERRSQRGGALTRKGPKRANDFCCCPGEPNACGGGCTEWIAGQGQFDEGAAQRFREFLAVLAKRDLPTFFNSDGGVVSQAVQIGLILRENRMTAGVARTVPEGMSCWLSTR
jgi:hypothetical protein